MGFEMGPKLLRRAPRGWLAARAFPLRHSVYSYPDADGGGETVLDMSWGLSVLWRVEPAGRPPYELEEERSGPTWLQSAPVGGGNRWYKVRVRPNYGLMRDVGVPGFVDPSDPSKLWIDWDAAYKEHVDAWEREARVRRAVSERTTGKLESTLDRLGNPFAGKLRPEEERLVEERIAREKARTAQQQEHYAALARQKMAAKGVTPAAPGESEELMRRIADLRRIHEVGRKAKATVVACEDTGRTFANVPVFLVTFDVEDRRIVFEHMYGPRLIKRYKPGAKVDVWIDPENPDAIVPN
jgi:hypothetical protein